MKNPSLPCSELLYTVVNQLPSLKVGRKGCILWYRSFTSISKCLRIHQSGWTYRSTCYFLFLSVGARWSSMFYSQLLFSTACLGSKSWTVLIKCSQDDPAISLHHLLSFTNRFLGGRKGVASSSKHSLSHGFMWTLLLIMWRKLCLDLWSTEASSAMGKWKGGVGVMWEDVEKRSWASSKFKTGHISCIGIPGQGELGL